MLKKELITKSFDIRSQTDILNRAFDFRLVFILELVLVAHHQVRVRHTELDGVREAEN